MRYPPQPVVQTHTAHQHHTQRLVYQYPTGFQSIDDEMDSLIDLSDPSKALDLSRIRYQLMSVPPPTSNVVC